MLLNSDSSPETGEYIQAKFPVPQKRVLVADDQPRMLEAVTAILEKSFEVVDVASDGQSALEATIQLEPDLVVLDISMPGMTGIDVARRLRKSASTARIVFLTIHEDAQILANCLAAGGLGYVLKGLMDSDLILAINEALAGRVFVSRFSSEAPSS